jgi:hypothetical protein
MAPEVEEEGDAVGMDADNYGGGERESEKSEHACGAECRNFGFCNERTRRCECAERFTGEFCEHSAAKSGSVHADYEECESRCRIRADARGKVRVSGFSTTLYRLITHYNYSNKNIV